MDLPVQILSTDFDGTVFAEFENPPVPAVLQALIGRMQANGVKWVVNTGRDLSGLMEAMGRAHLTIHPDYLVLVEREIYQRNGARYVGIEAWNQACSRVHEQLFIRVRQDLPRLLDWVGSRFEAMVYEDAYSPFCLIASDNEECDAIMEYLDAYCREVPGLTIMRNDVYARFSHVAYNKGTALAEIGRRLGTGSDRVLAAGDHLNDLPMLSLEHARYLVAPANAVGPVKEAVRRQGGYVSAQPCGEGLARGLEFYLESSPAGICLLKSLA